MIIVIDSSRIMQCQQCIFETEDNDNICKRCTNIFVKSWTQYDMCTILIIVV